MRSKEFFFKSETQAKQHHCDLPISSLALNVLNSMSVKQKENLKRKRCGGRSFVEAKISHVIEWKFLSKYIFDINLMLL